VFDEIVSFLLDFLDDVGEVFKKLYDFLICSHDPLKLLVIKLLVVSVSDQQNW